MVGQPGEARQVVLGAPGRSRSTFDLPRLIPSGIRRLPGGGWPASRAATASDALVVEAQPVDHGLLLGIAEHPGPAGCPAGPGRSRSRSRRGRSRARRPPATPGHSCRIRRPGRPRWEIAGRRPPPAGSSAGDRRARASSIRQSGGSRPRSARESTASSCARSDSRRNKSGPAGIFHKTRPCDASGEIRRHKMQVRQLKPRDGQCVPHRHRSKITDSLLCLLFTPPLARCG